ncbi:hypothetical protein PUN28_008740 [Cardiocondyla obscurior]|uniref:Uncharacterized protein n=1 Tax=Cardiocondyla obscurior TaxID=286306 RepID=A0AAW2G172_9HYME
MTGRDAITPQPFHARGPFLISLFNISKTVAPPLERFSLPQRCFGGPALNSNLGPTRRGSARIPPFSSLLLRRGLTLRLIYSCRRIRSSPFYSRCLLRRIMPGK